MLKHQNTINSMSYNCINSFILMLFSIMVLGYSQLCFGNEVIYIDISEKDSVEFQQTDLACRFYGINLKRIDLNKDGLDILHNKTNSNSCFIIASRALPYVKRNQFLVYLSRTKNKNPVLIVGITTETNIPLLKTWSGNTITGVREFAKLNEGGFYKVAYLPEICKELSGQDILFSKKFPPREYTMETSDVNHSIEKIIQAIAPKSNITSSIFLSGNFDGLETFFQAGLKLKLGAFEKLCWQYCTEDQSALCHERFMEIAPMLMFLQSVLGEQCWQGKGDYANLTIDDPWLIEPYGKLSYFGLLDQMKKVNFHTTIAFPAWNYDRSRTDVVELLRENQDRFSISIHGNNHNQREFNIYDTNLINAEDVTKYQYHELMIKQAVARMELFHNVTGIPYDNVMVFPHLISPAPTLGLLKKYNFLATFNGNNIPLGSKKHEEDPLSLIRVVNLNSYNFPSFSRFHPGSTPNSKFKNKILINLFLDNPVLLYSHHDLFEKGIDSFNETAEFINTIQPNTQWKSLGDIAQNAYIERLRKDGNYDIQSFSHNFVVENNHNKSLTYFIEKEESFSPPVKQISVDGQPFKYKKHGKLISLVLPIPANQNKHIVIEYTNDLDTTKVDISKNSLHFALLRYLSDFRDIILPRSKLGSLFVRYYYAPNFSKLVLVGVAFLVVTISIIVCCAIYIFKKRKPL